MQKENTDSIVLDNSKRKTYRSCQKKFNFQFNLGLQPINGSTALRFGSCWHAIQEGYHSWILQNSWPTRPEDQMQALLSGLELGKAKYEEVSKNRSFYDDYRNFNTAAEAFQSYLEYFSTDKDFIEIISTEQAFSCPIEPESSLEERLLKLLPPLIFTGRIDLCLKMDGVNWINDFKTTGWILDKVIAQANRSPQFIGYSYAGKRILDFETVGCLGNFMQVSSTKSKVTGEYGKSRFQFKRVPQIYSPGDVTAWKLSFIETALCIHKSYQENIWTESFDSCYEFGACPYLKLCQQHLPDEELNTEDFIVEFWNVLDD